MAYRRTDQVLDRLADKRARILAAAREIVAEGGWAAATVANVAVRAGVAAGTIYRYWPSKAELCAEVVADVSTREIGVVRAVAEADGTAVERLAAAVRTFAVRALRGRRLAYALIAEPVDPEVERVRLEYRAQLAGCFEQILRDGRREGSIEDVNPAIAAACMVGAFMEALVGPLAPAAATDGNRQLVEEIARFCLRATVGASLPLASGPGAGGRVAADG